MTLLCPLPFVTASASVSGAEHARLATDGQDGLAVRRSEDLVVAAVADGCGSAPFSEVGARLGAAWLVRAAATRHAQRGASEEAARAVHRDLLRGMRALARATAGRSREGFVADYLLFTFLVAIVDRASYVVFGIGDGAFAIDGATTILDSGPDNAPAYAAYALVSRLSPPELVIHARGSTRDLESLLVATDGAAHLLSSPQLAASRIARNPSLLKKSLVCLRSQGMVRDDASCVAIVRERRLDVEAEAAS